MPPDPPQGYIAAPTDRAEWDKIFGAVFAVLMFGAAIYKGVVKVMGELAERRKSWCPSRRIKQSLANTLLEREQAAATADTELGVIDEAAQNEEVLAENAGGNGEAQNNEPIEQSVVVA